MQTLYEPFLNHENHSMKQSNATDQINSKLGNDEFTHWSCLPYWNAI